MTEKQEPLQSIIKAEGDTYEQDGNSGISHMSNGSIEDGAKVAGVIYEAPSNKAEMNPSIVNHITLTISSSEKNGCSPKSDSSKQIIDKDGHETPNNSLTFSVVGSVEKINEKKLKSILRQLRNLSEDISVDIEDIELGSIRLILKGSQEGLERLETLFKSGKLTEIEGIPVENVQFVTAKDSELDKKRLVFTIDASISPEDLQAVKAAITETPDNNKEIKIDKKESRLVQEIRSQGARKRDLIGTDLSGAKLSNADLSGADLRGSHLNAADLSSANLSDANVSGADLSGADLSGADLSNAKLRGVYLSSADLSDADLSDADLSDANVSGANLSGADLSGANVNGARFGNNPGISQPLKQDLIQRGAIFDDSPGDRSRAKVLVPR